MKENEDYEVYERIKDYIYNEKIKDYLKEKLYYFNEMVLSFIKYNQKISNIIIDNFDCNDLNILTEGVINILEEYNIPNMIMYYEDFNYNRFESETLLVINDFKDFKKSNDKWNSNIDKIPKLIYDKHSYLLISSEDKIENNYFDNFNDEIFNLKEYIRISKNDEDSSFIADKIIKDLKDNNIKINFNKKDLIKVIDGLLLDHKVCNSNVYKYIYSKIINSFSAS